MFSNISVLNGIIFDVVLFVQLLLTFYLSFLALLIRYFFTNSVKLCGFKFEQFSTHFSSDFIFYKTAYRFSKTLFYGSLLRKILEILQFFQNTKIYKIMENLDIASFHKICLLATIITMRLLILKICRDENLISVLHF